MSKNKTPSAIVPMETDQAAPANTAVASPRVHTGRLYPSVDTPLSKCPTNLDLSTYAGRAAIMACGNPGDIQFGEDGCARILAVAYVIFPEEREDPETGEVGYFCRTCLIDSNLRVLRTTAAHAPHRIAAACDLFSTEEWRHGIPFVVKQRMGKAGRVYHDIRLEMKVG